MKQLLKRAAAALPEAVQQDLKRYHFRRQIKRDLFRPDEPDYERLPSMISAGDWVLDIGANVGQYTRKLSDLVGPLGRVFAFEPIPATFELLASNCARFPLRNVTLLNAAASSSVGLVHMSVPEWEPGGRSNFYQARVSEAGGAGSQYSVAALSVDTLALPRRVSFAKIDAEGHEHEVVRGMAQLIDRDHPIILAEGTAAEPFLHERGYTTERLPGSPNGISTYRLP
jgi:FkbM family methyltransferase